MLHHIRPSKLFSFVSPLAASDRIVSMKIPVRRIMDSPDYSLTLLELMILNTLLRINDGKRIFEIGTFLGNTTLHLALNSCHDAKVFTLDADRATLEKSGLADVYAARESIPAEFEGTFPAVAVQPSEKIVRLFGDSQTFDFSPFIWSMDLVFIDGDHSEVAVRVDSLNAGAMIRPGSGIIAWHDFQNPECIGNTREINMIAENRDVFHIEDTMLAVFFDNPQISQLLRLL